MTDLPDRLRALAESLPACEYVVPLRSAETCVEAASAIESMQRDHDAMEVLRTIGDVSITSWRAGPKTTYRVVVEPVGIQSHDLAEAILKAAGKE